MLPCCETRGPAERRPVGGWNAQQAFHIQACVMFRTNRNCGLPRAFLSPATVPACRDVQQSGGCRGTVQVNPGGGVGWGWRS